MLAGQVFQDGLMHCFAGVTIRFAHVQHLVEDQDRPVAVIDCLLHVAHRKLGIVRIVCWFIAVQEIALSQYVVRIIGWAIDGARSQKGGTQFFKIPSHS